MGRKLIANAKIIAILTLDEIQASVFFRATPLLQALSMLYGSLPGEVAMNEEPRTVFPKTENCYISQL